MWIKSANKVTVPNHEQVMSSFTIKLLKHVAYSSSGEKNIYTKMKNTHKNLIYIYIMFPFENDAIYNFLLPCLNFPWQEGQTNKYFPEYKSTFSVLRISQKNSSRLKSNASVV